MAIDFPNNPTNGDTYTVNGKTWQWDGTVWAAYGNYLDPGTLNVDKTNGRVGINNTNPTVALDVTGAAAISTDLTVGGDFTVSGTTTTINTTDLNVEDNIITLNYGVTGTPTLDAGIEVERGDLANTSITWDESAESWVVGGTAYVDTANGRVGIGTASPDRTLHVDSGGVGITATFRSSLATGGISLMGSGTTDDTRVRIGAEGNDLKLFSNNVERMRIDSSGNVGIGTSSPAVNLHVASDSTDLYLQDTNGTLGGSMTARIRITDSAGSIQGTIGCSGTASGVMIVDNNDGPLLLRTLSADDLNLVTNGLTRMYVKADGKIGIGASAPNSALEVNGSLAATSRTGTRSDSSITMSYDTSGNIGYIETWNSKPLRIRTYGNQYFNTNGTDRMTIDTSGNVGINTTSPAVALDVHGASRLQMDVSDGTYPKIGNYYSSGDNLEVGSVGGIDFVVDANGNTGEVFNWRGGGTAGAGTLLMQLNESGQLGIGGAANTSYTLAAGSAYFSSTVVVSSNNTSTPFYVGRYSGTNEAIGIRVADRDGYIFMNQDETSGASYIHIDNNGAAGSTKRTYFNCNIHVPSVVKSGTSTFQIKHPLPEMHESHWLIHTGIEGPNADSLYRGSAVLQDGIATVNLDEEARMTQGTFVALNRRVQCYTTNESDWTAVRGVVDGNILTITAQDPTSTATVSWMVIGERQDQAMFEDFRADENGRALVEMQQDDPSIAPKTWEEREAELASQEAG